MKKPRRPAKVSGVSGYERVAGDYYVEPAWAVEALFRHEILPGPIWDPCCGGGAILRVAREIGYAAHGSDIVDRGAPGAYREDFLNGQSVLSPCPVGSIVMNPPYSLAEPFIKKALALGAPKVAAILPLAFLESESRASFFASTPLARVWVSRSRISMPPGGTDIKAKGGTKAYAWLVFERGWAGPPQVRWFSRPKPVSETQAVANRYFSA